VAIPNVMTVEIDTHFDLMDKEGICVRVSAGWGMSSAVRQKPEC
jgi:hypothetical protein